MTAVTADVRVEVIADHPFDYLEVVLRSVDPVSDREQGTGHRFSPRAANGKPGSTLTNVVGGLALLRFGESAIRAAVQQEA